MTTTTTTTTAKPTTSWWTKLRARFSARDVGHFLAATVTSFLALIASSGTPDTKAAWLALIPGLASVVFRQAFPNVNVTSAQITGAVGLLKELTSKLDKTPPTPAPPGSQPIN